MAAASFRRAFYVVFAAFALLAACSSSSKGSSSAGSQASSSGSSSSASSSSSSSSSSASSSSSSVPKAPADQQVLRLRTTGEPNTIDPHLTNFTTSSTIEKSLFSALFSFNEKLEIIPD